MPVGETCATRCFFSSSTRGAMLEYLPRSDVNHLLDKVQRLGQLDSHRWRTGDLPDSREAE